MDQGHEYSRIWVDVLAGDRSMPAGYDSDESFSKYQFRLIKNRLKPDTEKRHLYELFSTRIRLYR